MQSFALDKYFFERIPKNGRFLYVPIALRGHRLYPTAHLWMKKITELHHRDDIRFDTIDELTHFHFDDMKMFDGMYIGGGNTWSLIQELEDSGFADSMTRFIEEGGCVYGGSAGAIILGKKINTHDDENKIGRQKESGFDLLGGYSLACHVRDEQSDRFKTWVIDNNSSIICLSEETGLVVENGDALCVGTKPCLVYFSDGTIKEFRSGQSIDLSYRPPDRS
jgi:dipeptidase E